MKYEKLTSEDKYDVKHITEISEKTGEVIEYKKTVYTRNGIEKLRHNQKKLKEDADFYDYISSEIGSFFFYFYSKIEAIDILPSYKTRFIYLASFIDYNKDDMVAKFDGKGNIKFKLNRQNLKDLLCLSDTEFRRTLKVLIDNDLIQYENKYYKVNTDYSLKGQNVDVKNNCTRIFIDNIRKLYQECEPRQHKQLYYIFKLLPHINLQYNVICSNVEEEIQECINPLSMDEIMEILHLDKNNRSKTYNDLRKFKINNDYVIGKFTIGDTDGIVCNPRLYYGGTQIDSLISIMGLFDMAKNKELKKQKKK